MSLMLHSLPTTYAPFPSLLRPTLTFRGSS